MTIENNIYIYICMCMYILLIGDHVIYERSLLRSSVKPLKGFSSDVTSSGSLVGQALLDGKSWTNLPSLVKLQASQ